MKFKHIHIVTVALIVMVTAACKKDLLKTNTNPDAATPNVYNPDFTLSEVQLFYTGDAGVSEDNWQTEWGGVAGYVQHIASTNTSYYYGDKYLLSTGNVSQYFITAYSTQVQPVVDLIHLTAGKPQYNNVHQMARIMRALVFQRLTDMYGDVPYSQAGLGYYERIYTPVYDKQQAIYTDMLKEVSQAVDSLNASGELVTGDLYYSSLNPNIITNVATQVSQWKKFGNSLLLRLAMRLTKIDPVTAQSWVTKAVQGGLMTSVNDNAIVHHTDSLNSLTYNRDANAIIFEDQTDVQLCRTFIDTLQKNNDARITVYSWIYPTQDNTPAHQLGLPPGFVLGGTDPTTDITKQVGFPTGGLTYYSRINGVILNYSAPNFIITYAQTELLLADAAERFGAAVGGDAVTHYRNAVEAGFTQLGAYNPPVPPTAAQADAMLTAHPLSSDKSTALNQINTQYWITCFMDEYEAWANWRRTSSTGDKGNTSTVQDDVSNVGGVITKAPRNVSGYPQLHATDYKANITNGNIPRRLQYPVQQQFSNPTNYKIAVGGLTGGDVQTARIWWDPAVDKSLSGSGN